MARNPFQNATSGDELGPPFAVEHNAFLDAWARTRNDEPSARDQFPTSNRSIEIDVKNSHSSDVPARGVLGIVGPLFTPTENARGFRNNPILDCTEPTNDHYGRFIVTTQPHDVAKIRTGIVAGLAVVNVDVVDALHRFADVKSGDATQLQSGLHGSARLITPPTTTGTRELLVLLAAGDNPIIDATAAANIPDGGSGSVTIRETGETVTAHLEWITGAEQISNGKNIRIRWNEFDNRFVIHHAECET